jgi:hypothetical protein
VDWIHLAENKIQCSAFGSTFRVYRNFMANRATIKLLKECIHRVIQSVSQSVGRLDSYIFSFLLFRKLSLPKIVLSCATDWTIGVVAFDFRRVLRIFLFTTASRTALGPTQPSIQWVPGALSLGVKRQWREADHSLPSSAEVKE